MVVAGGGGGGAFFYRIGRGKGKRVVAVVALLLLLRRRRRETATNETRPLPQQHAKALPFPFSPHARYLQYLPSFPYLSLFLLCGTEWCVDGGGGG